MLAAIAAVTVAVGACGSPRSRRSTTGGPSSATSSTAPTTTTSPPGQADTAVSLPSVVPVVACPTTYGVSTGSHPFVPRKLPTSVATAGLSFYSNGLLTVLAPAGWTCTALVAADGGEVLDAYPTGQADLSTHQIPPGTPVVQIIGEYTGHGPGAELVCPLFPSSPAATFMGGSPPCPAAPPGETTSRLTDDVVVFADPPGVRGTGAGSGASLASSGAAVYPQVGSSASVDVRAFSCTVPAALSPLCTEILADFLARNPPTYNGAQS